MKLNKFKLINGGKGGIEINADEYLSTEENNFQIVDDVTRKRKIPLSSELLAHVDELKYYLLVIAGYWNTSFNKFYDKENRTIMPIPANDPPKPHLILKELWNKVEIIGADANIKGFLLKGTIEVSDNKIMSLNTPRISDEDGFAFYDECFEVLDAIADEVINYIKSCTLSLERAKEVIEIQGSEEKSEVEITEAVIDKLQSMGGLVMIEPGSKLDSLMENNAEGDVEVHESGSLGNGNIETAEEVNEEPVQQELPTEEEDPDPEWDYTPPVEMNPEMATPSTIESEDGRIEPTDPSSLEHSENLGVEGGFDD